MFEPQNKQAINDNTIDEPILTEPEAPEEWECCGSECGDACIHTIYRKEKQAYDAQQKRLSQLKAKSAQNND